MTKVYTDDYTLLNAGKKGYPGFQGQDMISIQQKYEAAALASGSTIYMFLPPVGAIWTGKGKLFYDDLGASTITLAVGIVGNTTKFSGATDAQTAAGETVLAGGVDGLGYVFDGATPVIITTAGSQAATGTIGLQMDFQLQ